MFTSTRHLRTKDQIDKLVNHGIELEKQGKSRKQAAMEVGMSYSYYCNKLRERGLGRYGVAHPPQETSAPETEQAASNSTDSVKNALAILRSHGIRIPRSMVQSARLAPPKIKHRDLKSFRRWCLDVWDKRERFVVGWGGTAKSPHLVFHSLTGLQHRQAHASKIRGTNTEEKTGL